MTAPGHSAGENRWKPLDGAENVADTHGAKTTPMVNTASQSGFSMAGLAPTMARLSNSTTAVGPATVNPETANLPANAAKGFDSPRLHCSAQSLAVLAQCAAGLTEIARLVGSQQEPTRGTDTQV